MTDPVARGLLPKQNSTPYELANLGAMVEAWPLDPDEVRRQSDPMLCDVELLPWLAFDRGLRLWRDDWPEIKRRRYVRDAWIYLRLQGTPLGAEALLNVADGLLIGEVLPPAQAFAVPDDGGLTHAEVLALMPQLRLYHHFPPQLPAFGACFAGGVARGITAPPDASPAGSVATVPRLGTPEATFYAGADFAGPWFAGPALLLVTPVVEAPRPDDGLPRPPHTGCQGALFAVPDEARLLGRYPVLFDPATGVEAPLDVIDVDEGGVTAVLARQSFGGWGFFAGVGAAGGPVLLGDAFGPDPIVFDLADPDMETLRASPDMRAAQAAAGKFAGFATASATFATADLGDTGTYDRLFLYDPGRLPIATGAARSATYAGVTWLGLKPYHQILTAAMPADPPAVPVSWLFAGSTYALPLSQPRLATAMEALGTAKRAGDRILVELAPSAAGTRAAALPAMEDI